MPDDIHASPYRVRSDATWDLAREAYLAGETAEAYVARRDGADADAVVMASRVASRVADLARRITASDPRDTAGSAVIDAELSRLDAEIRGGAPKSPDKTDTPDPLFTPPP